MNYDEYLAIKAEITQLEALLAAIPPDSILEKMSLEERLKSAKAALEGVREEALPHKATLTFQGTPVLGTHGASASFLSKASSLFSDAVAAVADGSKQKNQLIITGVAKGSFGFQYEVPISQERDLFDGNRVERSLELVRDLFEYSAERSDDELAELMAVIDRRAIKKIADFLKCVSENHAWCAVSFRGKYFKYKDLAQISASSNRLQENNIHENEVIFEGELLGCLPKGRTFEFAKKDSGETIRGKVGLEVEHPEELNKYLSIPLKIKLHSTQVGNGKPRYALLSMNNIEKLS